MANKRVTRVTGVPVHPGRILQLAISELGISQMLMAKHIGVKQSYLNEICRGKRGISAEMAMKLGRAFGQSPLFWLNLQNSWELSQLEESRFKAISRIAA